jgi:hypothetical protein
MPQAKPFGEPSAAFGSLPPLRRLPPRFVHWLLSRIANARR